MRLSGSNRPGTISPPTPTSAEEVSQTSGDVFSLPLDTFVLDQLKDQDRLHARRHAKQLTAYLAEGRKTNLRMWAASRVATEDAICQFLAGCRTAVMAQNKMSRVAFSAAREFDRLANSAHRRQMDWLEVLRRLDTTGVPQVTIRQADQVAIVSSPRNR